MKKHTNAERCEMLEPRRLLATAVLGSFVLIVTGDDSSETITIHESGDRQTTYVTVNGSDIEQFRSGLLEGIKVSGRGGNDKITIFNSLTAPATLLGEAGQDLLDCGDRVR